MKTQTEFTRHINLHRLRVLRLGLELGKSHYEGLPLSDLEKFLKLHDLSKTLQSKTLLAEFGYTHVRFPVDRLFQFFGIKNPSNSQAKQLRELVSDINTVDENIARRFFEVAKGIDAKTQTAFYEIERVADLVDRSLDPVAAEEFGHPMVPASEFIQESHLVGFSRWLENLYPEFTKNLSY